MLPYIAEFLGTMMLILLGDGVVANVTLNKSGMKGAGSIQITFAWGLAVMIPAYIFGAASGASLIRRSRWHWRLMEALTGHWYQDILLLSLQVRL
jgi:hypothetical protein